MFKNLFFFFENPAFSLDNVDKCDTARHGRVHALCVLDNKVYKHACRITFPQQQWSRERASLIYFHVHCLSRFSKYCIT